ncbi:ArsR family transcriptional regulator [Candidatus Bathyarchaeota archaeon]|nr:ArsR family transcriptional regulator [Candidatus Bathyarchaeota archaeon]
MADSPTSIDYLSWVPLREALERLFEEILNSIKALSHENRLKIMMYLLDGTQSFHGLKLLVGLKKTALANHIKQLLDAQLIQKPEYATYEITTDGKRLLEALVESHEKAAIGRKLREKEKRQLSAGFIRIFFNK